MIAILSGRLSQSSIETLVEQIWASKQLAWFEQMAVAKNKKNLPYKAEPRQMFEGQVTCGANPWVEANRVFDLEAYIDESGCEHLIWKYRKSSLEEGKVKATYITYHLVKETDDTEHYVD